MNNHILFVNPHAADILSLMPFFEHKDIKVSTVNTLQEGILAVENNHDIDVVIADTELIDEANIDFFRTPILKPRLYLAGQKYTKKIEQYVRDCHAEEFLKKPISITALENIFTAASLSELPAHQFGKMIGASPVMQTVYQMIERVAPTNASVFVIGKSGTGKELVAEAIHHYSKRARKPYLAINCGAIASELICSALFGHEKGSFTGAFESHIGYFAQASGGTLFLDEITETSLDFQVKLLRVLETNRVIPVGGKRQIPVDTRIVGSTNRCPEEAVKEGKLREDLYYRLNVFPIHLPLLQDRAGDIELLTSYFLKGYNDADHKNIQMSPEALAVVNSLPYAGNVRELKNLIYRAYILADEVIERAHIQPNILMK